MAMFCTVFCSQSMDMECEEPGDMEGSSPSGALKRSSEDELEV